MLRMRVPCTQVADTVIRLREARRMRELSVSDVAKACSVPVFVVQSVEDGAIDPTVTLLEDYAKFVGFRFVVLLAPGVGDDG